MQASDRLRKSISVTRSPPGRPRAWDLQELSLAALYFNPALDLARARLARADAAIVTAGARPNPTLGISPGIPSPYLLALDFAFPIETAGKRGYRVQIARNLDQAARFDLADSAWTVLSGVRLALLNYLLASRSLEMFRSEEQVRADQVHILEQIFAAGEIPRVDVDLRADRAFKSRSGPARGGGPNCRSQGHSGGRALGFQWRASRTRNSSWPDHGHAASPRIPCPGGDPT